MIVRDLHLASGQRLATGRRPLVMGILNATPDSFYPASRVNGEQGILDAALRMAADGADLLDIGGESSRPGSEYVDAAEEVRRVIPAIRAIRQRTSIPISIDTRKAEVARAALDEGADIINDISALRDDPELGSLAADRKCPVILMHMRGTPLTMQREPYYADTIGEIIAELGERVAAAKSCGVSEEAILLDPGIGFGKRPVDNLLILQGIGQFCRMGFPVVVGVSRKGFIGKVAGGPDGPLPVEERLAGSLAAAANAVVNGADILRVHDVRETAQLVRVLNAIETASLETTGELAE